jgi:hypothetical protein
MAYPVANSPMFPSVNDAPFLPPKLKDMPVFNPGSRFYQCDDGSTRWMTEAEAINAGMSCRVISAPAMAGRGFPVRNLGQAAPAAGAAPAAPSGGPPGGQGNPQGASIQSDMPFDQSQFVWPGYPLVSPLNYPVTPAGTSCAWETDTAGNDIYVCRPAVGAVRAPALYAAGPISYPVQTFFAGPF